MACNLTRLQIQRILRWEFAGVFFITAIWALSLFYLIGFNTTKSLPGYVYLVIRYHHPAKNELVAFHPPPNDFYPHRWFIKYVKGAAGDVVRWDGRVFSINDQPLGSAKVRSENGIALARGTEGQIPPHYYFVWSEHADSFDSRYAQIDLVHRDRIIGRAYRLF
ncbi:MAG: type IV secretory pathway protease TraF-like protein [Nitrospira sp. SB0677_bin_15]|nr:type IV secretory pathway protease TraF-like protein [Nitrospira sp. SB0667_bin_9]MYD32217.1 type IV secretory pathway protease TraF-like protein [Nitrospira sp. SB0661_bin_20]MYG39489.1 type IV secretory pathway protease TraF-like protein [Nitrospira sp. SB0677_bin_15]MYJ23622.1 type IV secretory pathway protease TraF-like protein [Nitrospira sp. SB0673_bin_12]